MASPNLFPRQLRAFLALTDQHRFTKAASACHLSQPAFNALICTREQALNTRLFEPSARQLLGDFVVAVSELGDYVKRRKGRAHVAALPSLPAGRLPAIFASSRNRGMA